MIKESIHQYKTKRDEDKQFKRNYERKIQERRMAYQQSQLGGGIGMMDQSDEDLAYYYQQQQQQIEQRQAQNIPPPTAP